MITSDRNDPETVAWLDLCRRLRPEMTADEFEECIPSLIELGQEMQRDKLIKGFH